MPRPLATCSYPGCPKPVRSGRCPEHTVERWKDPEQQAFYNSTRWKRLRAQVRREEPICRLCRVRPTSNVDHADGNWRNNRRENLRGLCTPCERTRTARQHNALQR